MDFEISSEEEDNYEETNDLLLQLQRRQPSFLNVKLLTSPLDFHNDQEVVERFRFSKQTILDLLHLIGPHLEIQSKKEAVISPMFQLLLGLRFYANGSFQITNGDLQNISQPSASRIIRRVSRGIASLTKEFIKYPSINDAEEIKRRFADFAAFPGVVGAIDCTHVKIKSPGGPNAELYRNRKGFFSINVQAVWDHEGTFTNLVARWPGSVHDSRIFDNSLVRAQLGDQEVPGILVGESGYVCLPYLMSPIESQVTEAQRRYNYAQVRTRNIIERGFGMWKRRFHCLGSEFRTSLQTTLTIICACAVLHNLAKQRLELEPLDNYVVEEVAVVPNREQNAAGNAMRQTIIQNHFTN